MENRVCGVIVAYNTGKDIIHTVEAIKNQVEKLLIVDNGSSEETICQLKLYKNNSNIEVIYNEENKGIAAALNEAVKYAISNDFNWLLTLDDDSLATPNMVSELLDVYNHFDKQTQKKVAFISPKHVEKFNAKNITNDYFYNVNNIQKVTIDMTSGNLVRCDIFKTVGVFNENLFIDFVDHEFCLRINKEGYEIFKVNSIYLLHSLGNSKDIILFGKRITVTNHSPLRRYYITRNRFYCWKIFKDSFPQWVKEDKKRFINESIKIILYENNKFKKLKMILRGITDYKNNKFGKFLC